LASHRETAELTGDRAARLEIAESEAEYAGGEFVADDEARTLFGLPSPSHSLTNSGLPVRVPAALPVRAVDTVIDLDLLRRVLERLRRL
jgi:hypothetical protein